MRSRVVLYNGSTGARAHNGHGSQRAKSHSCFCGLTALDRHRKAWPRASTRFRVGIGQPIRTQAVGRAPMGPYCIRKVYAAPPSTTTLHIPTLLIAHSTAAVSARRSLPCPLYISSALSILAASAGRAPIPLFLSPFLCQHRQWRHPADMSTELVSSLPVRSATQAAVHPLAPLSGDEIKAASAIIQSAWPHGTNLHFKAVTLEEPPKAQVVPYLDAEHSGAPLPSIPRKAFINYYIRNTVSSPVAEIT